MMASFWGRSKRKACAGCSADAGFDFPITMAFQPIVDLSTRRIFAYEALVRGADGTGAQQILSRVTPENRYAFDQKCRVTAITMAAELGLAERGALLSINFLPNAVYEPSACIGTTLEAAERVNFPTGNILFEFCENEALDTEHLLHILRTYDSMGFKTAIDDFGAGYAGLSLLSRFQPDYVKLDMELVRNIDTTPVKQVMMRHTIAMLDNLGVTPICEGIETAEEASILSEIGISLQQGYIYARPALATLPVVH
ncbi:EAL domain-containing protein [Asaia lannensis]|nr:EAL domain-containing protein [Asaia lannensis]GBR01297.1 diguanylate phosphodiesterase [Asaia lannensis NBRC 102526]